MTAIAEARRPDLRLGDGAGAPFRVTLPLADAGAHLDPAAMTAHWELGDGGPPLAAAIDGDAWAIDHRYEQEGLYDVVLVCPGVGGMDRRVPVTRLVVPGPSTVIAVAGSADLDEGGRVDVLGIAGRGTEGRLAIDLRFDGDAVHLVMDRLEWLVRTNKGWAHARGSGRLGRSTARWPFRLDVRSAPGDRDGDRIALRLYPPGSNPNLESPARKLAGSFREPAVRLFDRD